MANRPVVTIVAGIHTQIPTTDTAVVGSGITTSTGNISIASAGGTTNLLDVVSLASYSDFTGIAAPGTPATHAGRLYYKLTNAGFFYKDDGGTEHGLVSTPALTSISSNVTLANNSINFVDTSAARSLALPSPASTSALIVIKDTLGTAQTNNITITQNASEKIEGVAASYVIQANWASITFATNGTDWFIL